MAIIKKFNKALDNIGGVSDTSPDPDTEPSESHFASDS